MLKRSIFVLVLIILSTACVSQVTVLTPEAAEQIATNTVETIPTATSTPLVVAPTDQLLPTIDTTCAGAPPPHVKVGEQVTVLVNNSDKLKLRSDRNFSPDTVMEELDEFTQLIVLKGPSCIHSDETDTNYWFWQVRVLPNGEVGWVSEGDTIHYFIEDSFSTPAAVDASATPLTCLGTARLKVGQPVTVVTDDTDKLKVHEAPTFTSLTMMELDKGTKLNIIDGPVCVYSDQTSIYYWFWKVQILPQGETGWVAEGDFFRNFIE